MNRFQGSQSWFEKNQRLLSERCRYANMGKTPDNLPDGRVWIQLEADSRTIEMRVLNSA